VVDALRKLHAALAPDGKVVDTQPLSPRPALYVDGRPIGSLDMREWARTIASVDAEVEQVLGDEQFAVEIEERFLVTDSFDSGSEFLDEAHEWAGTRVPSVLEAKIRGDSRPITLEQEVRLRLLAKPA
jgi:hypothetical protein